MRNDRNSPSLALLQELQYGEGKPLLLISQDPSGMGAQIHRRLCGLKMALRYGRKAVFELADDPPYGQIFEPIHSAVNFREALANSVDCCSPDAATVPVVQRKLPDLWAKLESHPIYATQDVPRTDTEII